MRASDASNVRTDDEPRAKRMIAVDRFLPCGATLGEGPIWDREGRAFWFVNIVGARLHRIGNDGTGHLSWDAPDRVCWALPATDGRLLVGLRKGLASFDKRNGSFRTLAEIERALPHNRLNDAGIGPEGDVWFGTMDDSEKAATGRYYRFDGERVHDVEVGPRCISNGPAVSPDGATLYTVDTLARRIDAHTIAGDRRVSAARCFATISGDHGYPDGVCCDAEGGVWVGIWGGAKACRFDRDGVLTDEIRFPVSNVTKIALGGPDGRTAIATTARKGLSAEQLRDQPCAGDVFTFRTEIPGWSMPLAKLGTPAAPRT